MSDTPHKKQSHSFSTDAKRSLQRIDGGFVMDAEALQAAIHAAKNYEVPIPDPCGPFGIALEGVDTKVHGKPVPHTFIRRPDAHYSLAVTIDGSVFLFGVPDPIRRKAAQPKEPNAFGGSLSPEAMGMDEASSSPTRGEATMQLSALTREKAATSVLGNAVEKMDPLTPENTSVELFNTQGKNPSAPPTFEPPDIITASLGNADSCIGDRSGAAYSKIAILEIPYTAPSGETKHLIAMATPEGLEVFISLATGEWRSCVIELNGKQHNMLSGFGSITGPKPAVFLVREGDVVLLGLHDPQTKKTRVIGISPTDMKLYLNTNSFSLEGTPVIIR